MNREEMCTIFWFEKLHFCVSDIHEESNTGDESLAKRMKTEHGKSQVRVSVGSYSVG